MTADPPPAPPEAPPVPDIVQMNVRIPRALRDRIDARRATVTPEGMSRDKWVANALDLALRVSAARSNARGRTAPPPTRRGI